MSDSSVFLKSLPLLMAKFYKVTFEAREFYLNWKLAIKGLIFRKNFIYTNPGKKPLAIFVLKGIQFPAILFPPRNKWVLAVFMVLNFKNNSGLKLHITAGLRVQPESCKPQWGLCDSKQQEGINSSQKQPHRNANWVWVLKMLSFCWSYHF